MKNICFINGSLRGKKASSLVFLNCIDGLLAGAEFNKEHVSVRAKAQESRTEDDLETIARADAIVMVFPLFTYAIPGALMRLLEDFYRYARANRYNRAARVYVVANGGFYRPEIMAELIRVMKNFCRRLSLDWRFAVCIGAGPVAAATVRVPLLNMRYRRAFSAIASDIKDGGTGQERDYFIRPFVPKRVILFVKAQYEKKMKAGAARTGNPEVGPAGSA